MRNMATIPKRNVFEWDDGNYLWPSGNVGFYIWLFNVLKMLCLSNFLKLVFFCMTFWSSCCDFLPLYNSSTFRKKLTNGIVNRCLYYNRWTDRTTVVFKRTKLFGWFDTFDWLFRIEVCLLGGQKYLLRKLIVFEVLFHRHLQTTPQWTLSSRAPSKWNKCNRTKSF